MDKESLYSVFPFEPLTLGERSSRRSWRMDPPKRHTSCGSLEDQAPRVEKFADELQRLAVRARRSADDSRETLSDARLRLHRVRDLQGFHRCHEMEECVKRLEQEVKAKRRTAAELEEAAEEALNALVSMERGACSTARRKREKHELGRVCKSDRGLLKPHKAESNLSRSKSLPACWPERNE